MAVGRRLTGSLSREDADSQWHELVESFRNLRRPERIMRRKYGKGWALYAVPAHPDNGKPR